jgi:FMN phosphatase YigB (HAD superfamily)
MDKAFSEIYSVGFDLDQTLYSPNQDINDRIRNLISEKVLEKIPNLISISGAREFYEKKYKEMGSGTKVLSSIGYGNAGDVMYGCLGNAEIDDLLEYDPKLRVLLKKIQENYDTFLITGTAKDQAIPRLEKIGADLEFFNTVIFGDSNLNVKKLDGSVYNFFLDKSKYLSKNHVYIGDSRLGDILPTKKLGMMAIAVHNYVREADFSLNKISGIKDLLL